LWTKCSHLLNNHEVETRRLQFLRELALRGSMRAVAEEMDVTTSTVSQQIAVLAEEFGTPLIEPVGRRVRLTPAGRRLAEHAVTILAAVEAARSDLDADAEPAGVVRVAGFATAIRRTLLPLVAGLANRYPELRVSLSELEPGEAHALLAADEIDLALTYDYNLAPASIAAELVSRPLGSAQWGLGVPSDSVDAGDEPSDALVTFRRYRHHGWIVNSRNTADADVVRIVASMAGFEPRVAHLADSLDLVQDLIVAGLGVGLLPADRATLTGVRLFPLHNPDVLLRAWAVTRRGRTGWPPLAVVLDGLLEGRSPVVARRRQS
jgi:DNA-binding transcriptional LysR family regulator